MTAPMIVALLAWAVIFGLGFHSPGTGLAFAAVLGRYEFPLRGDSALFVAAPVLIVFALVGLLASRRRHAFMTAPDMAAAVLGFCILGALTTWHAGNLNPLGFERLMMLATYVLPLTILAGSLSQAEQSRFRIWIVRTAVAIAAIAFIVGSVDHSGRAAALGGGPIPLAQLCMFGLLMVAMFDDDFVPFLDDKNLRIASRAAIGVLLLIVGIQTASRFPILAVALAAFFSAVSWSAHQGRLLKFLRSYRRHAVGGAIVLLPVIFAARGFFDDQVSKRFGLLTTNFLGEVQRSRGQLFEYSWAQAVQSLPTGYGPGNFLVFYFDGSDSPIVYPHNILLEVVGDYGLPGLVVLGLVVGKLFFSKENTHCDPRYLMLGFYALAISFSSGDLVHNRYLFLFGTLLIVSRQQQVKVEAAEPATVPQVSLAQA